MPPSNASARKPKPPARTKVVRAWSGMLPGGTSTTDSARYSREWRALAAPLEKALGLHLHSFDPGIALSGSDGREYVQFDKWVVVRLNAALTGTVRLPGKGRAK